MKYLSGLDSALTFLYRWSMKLPLLLQRTVLLSSGILLVSCADQGASTLYFGTSNDPDSQAVFHVPADGGEPVSMGRYLAAGLAFDPCGENLVIGKNNIYTLPLDGSKTKVLAGPGQQVFSLAVDTTNNHFYWVSKFPDSKTRSIERANLDDGRQRIVLVKDIPIISDIAVDPKRQRLYWSVTNSSPQYRAGLWRAKLDGSGAERLPLGDYKPHELAVDSRSGELFFDVAAREFTSEIRVGQSDGTGERTILTELLWEVEDIAIDSNGRKLYWAERERGAAPDRLARIRRCNLDGSKIETIQAIRAKNLFFSSLTLGHAPGETGGK